MQTFLNKMKLVWTDTTLRKRVLFVLFALIIFRLLSAVPIPSVDAQELARFLSSNQFFGVLNIFSEEVDEPFHHHARRRTLHHQPPSLCSF